MSDRSLKFKTLLKTGVGSHLPFKKTMNPGGRFYKVELPLHHTPLAVSALLKYKKHEWIVVAFEKQKNVDMLWVNKGSDNSSANVLITVDEVARIAEQHQYSSVFMFHNHPNSNPAHYDCTKPSKQDLETASKWARGLNALGINVVKYVCERGRHYRYLLSISKSFLPVETFTSEIAKQNGQSRLKNLALHLERLF